MNNQPAEKLIFELFLDAVKRKDKMQFAYYDLYCAIKHADELEVVNTHQSTGEMAFEL